MALEANGDPVFQQPVSTQRSIDTQQQSGAINSANSEGQHATQPLHAHQQTVTLQSKPVIPKLNFTKHEGLGFGSTGGIDASISARVPSAAHQALFNRTKPGTLTARGATSTSALTTVSPKQQEQPTTALASDVPASAAASSSEEAGAAWESGAISAAQALKRYTQYLTSFEQSEILDSNEVYFVGRSGALKIHGNRNLNKANFGYDDDRGDYNVVLHDHLRYRYEVLSIMGKGSFGQVLKCHDFRTNELVAIKIIRNKKRFHHQALVELKVLKYLVQQDPGNAHNVVHMLDYFTFRSHLCIAFEPLSINLYEFLKQNNFAGLSLGLIRRFAQQMLVSLKFMKDLNIIHCDLKPENVMLRHPNRSVIKVIDFGSSCMTDERVYTYIQSRFYRAPEVILGLQYSTAIDMWSFGCILAELYTGYPMFPGEDESEQLQCIMEILNVPSKEVLEESTRLKLFFDTDLNPRITVNSQGKVHSPGTKTLHSVLKCNDASFLDLLSSCFSWDPAQRLTPEQALKHPWMLETAAASTPRGAAKQPVHETVVTSVPPTGTSLVGTSGMHMLSSQPSTSLRNVPLDGVKSAAVGKLPSQRFHATPPPLTPRQQQQQQPLNLQPASTSSPRSHVRSSISVDAAGGVHAKPPQSHLSETKVGSLQRAEVSDSRRPSVEYGSGITAGRALQPTLTPKHSVRTPSTHRSSLALATCSQQLASASHAADSMTGSGHHKGHLSKQFDWQSTFTKGSPTGSPRGGAPALHQSASSPRQNSGLHPAHFDGFLPKLGFQRS